MKKSRFTEEKIVHTLKRQEAGEAIKDIVRELGITEQTFYAFMRGSENTPALASQSSEN